MSIAIPRSAANTLHQMTLLIHILAKSDAVPSIFSCNIDKPENVQPVKRSALEKLNQWRAASEGEGDMAVSTRTGEELISRKTQTYEDDICLTNRFHVAVRLFSNRSQMTSKCGKNK